MNFMMQESTVSIEHYFDDITEKVKKNPIPIIGRDYEINRAIQILTRKDNNSLVFIGESGVGKTTLVYAIAQRIVSGDVPTQLKNAKILQLHPSELLADTQYRGALEKRIIELFDMLYHSKMNVIVFIDEIHTITQSTNVQNNHAASILENITPLLKKYQYRLIGTSNPKDFNNQVESQASFRRMMKIVNIEEPTRKEAIEILQGIKTSYENHYQIKIDESALIAAVDMSQRYLPQYHLPHKAIDLLDDAASQLTVNHAKSANIQNIEQESKIALQKYDLDKLAELEVALFQEKELSNHQYSVLTKNHIAKVLSEQTRIPVDKMLKGGDLTIQEMKDFLSKRVIGQDEIINAICPVLKYSDWGLENPNRPLASFIFQGTTGVGKTLLCKALAEMMFNDEKHLIRLDMSEYMLDISVNKLIGSPSGYQGSENGGILTEQVRQKPYSVILFDEIEKANVDILNLLLQILDEGHITDSRGQKINFKNTIIVLTTNLDSDELEEHLRPELRNRVTNILQFKPLDLESFEKIAENEVNILKSQLSNKNISLEVSPLAMNFLIKKGFSQENGARFMTSIINKYLRNGIVELSCSDFSQKQLLMVNVDNAQAPTKLTFNLKRDEDD